MAAMLVREAMQPVPIALRPNSSLGEATARLAASGSDALPVVDADGRYRGTVIARQIEEAMRENSVDVTVETLMRDVPTLRADETLDRALEALLHDGVPGVPVVAPGSTTVIGWLTHRDVLRAYRRQLPDRR
jgi:CIC family chloride channel protein